MNNSYEFTRFARTRGMHIEQKKNLAATPSSIKVRANTKESP
jgi:hypothetical protein